MEPHFSTLELVKYDETARAPERDHHATAFELDASVLAPQVVPDTTPQVSYDSSFPEVHGVVEDPLDKRTSSHHITKAALKWPWIVVVLVVAAAIAIGAGVGTWRQHENTPDNPSTTISPTPPQNHTIAPAAQYILNDTSLAALVLNNGERQLFFQDSDGLITRVVRTTVDGQWNMAGAIGFQKELPFGPGFINPQNYTPLAVTVSGDQEHNTTIVLYYVSETHQLTSLPIEGPDGSTFQESGQESEDNYSTAVDTRSLSIALIPGANMTNTSTNSTTNMALLYYENPAGNVSALLQRSTVTEQGENPFQWFDISSQSSQGLPGDFRNVANDGDSHTLHEWAPGTTLSGPFTSKVNFYGQAVVTDIGKTGFIGALFYQPDKASFASDAYYIGPSGTGNHTEFDTYPTDSPIRHSDLVTFGQEIYMWINGTQPVMDGDESGDGDPPPLSSFPFTRLASVDTADYSTTFLYHQINGTTFAEEKWENSLGSWLPSEYIIISR